MSERWSENPFPLPWTLGIVFIDTGGLTRQQILSTCADGLRLTVLEAHPAVCKIIIDALKAKEEVITQKSLAIEYVNGLNRMKEALKESSRLDKETNEMWTTLTPAGKDMARKMLKEAK